MSDTAVSACSAEQASCGQGAPRAHLLSPADDVATALSALAPGTVVKVSHGAVTYEVRVQDDIPVGHKFAVRTLARGLRVRKYGEFIGRTTQLVLAGSWVHGHNLVTSARHDPQHERAWYDAAEVPQSLSVMGEGRCCVAENPLYDEAADRLFWIDVRETPAIHMVTLADGIQTTWPMGEDIGAAALAGPGRLLLALRSGFAFFDVATAALSPIMDPEPDLPLNRMNDGKCDSTGRYWCGSMNPESGTADGSLYVLDQNMQCRKVLDDFLTPNGMTWSLDGATLYLADTRRGVIQAYAFDARSGDLGEPRVFADLGAMPGGPDGATVDAQGYLWWAQFDGGCLVRFAPDGRMDRVIRLPVTKPTSCAFGGAGYRRLFVTTATRGLSEEGLRREPHAGRVLVLDVGVCGMPPVPFGSSPLAQRQPA